MPGDGSSPSSSARALIDQRTGHQGGGEQNEEVFRKHGLVLAEGEEEYRLDWDRSSSDYPRNWSRCTKIYAVAVVSWLELYMTAISSSGTATATTARMTHYDISRTLAYFLFTSIYLIGQTIGGIVCAPISEAFGRRTIYIIGAGLFCVASAIAGSIPSLIAVAIGRFCQGLASAIPATVAFGTFSDMYDAHTRVIVVYIYTFSGMFGLAAGPIFASALLSSMGWSAFEPFAAYVSTEVGYRWVYWISTMVSFASVLAARMIKESNADQLLEKRVDAVRSETGDKRYKSVSEHGHTSIKEFARTALFRPLFFLVTEPVVFFCAVLCAIAFGLIYGLTEGLTVVYTAPPFSFSDESASLSFIPIIIGEVINVVPRFYEHWLIAKYKREGKRILPETKIRSFAVAAPALALGLWLFAWTIPPRVTDVPWPISMIGLACIGFALNDFSYVLFGYATDSYGAYAASAVSAISLTRTLIAAVFPLFSYYMFSGLGSNVAATILASVATPFAFTPVLFLGFGAKLRRHSKYASNDEDSLEEENAHLRSDEKGGLGDHEMGQPPKPSSEWSTRTRPYSSEFSSRSVPWLTPAAA